MKVKVNLRYWYASLAKTSEVEIELDGETTTVDHIIRKLVNIVDKEFREKIVESKTGELILPPPRVAVNNELVPKPYNFIKISNGDEVTLFPPVAGG